MVEIVSGYILSDEIDVVECIHAANLEHLSPGESLPIKSEVVEEVGEVGAKLRQEFDGVGSYEYVLCSVDLEDDGRSGKNVLKGVIAVREPP